MKFTKMHGIGNDYVYVNCFKETVENPCEVAKFVSDRHFGIGSDGLILIKPSKVADCYMDMYNADGSSSAMCGNGIRCVAKYIYDYGLTDKTEVDIETAAGIKHIVLTIKDGKVEKACVDMGEPILKPELIPVVGEGEMQVDEPIIVEDREFRMTCVSMGNPHAVVFLDEDVKNFELEKYGPKFENHERFPERKYGIYVCHRPQYHEPSCMGTWFWGNLGMRNRNLCICGSSRIKRTHRAKSAGTFAWGRFGNPLECGR